MRRDHAIRVSKTVGVPAEFHSRHDVISRSYLYRLAVFPPACSLPSHQFHGWVSAPVTKRFNRKQASHYRELNTCVNSKLSALERGFTSDWYLKDGETFDFDLFKATLKLMEGKHNFSNFTKAQGLFKYQTVGGERYVRTARSEEERTRTVRSIEVSERAPPLPLSVYPVYGTEQVQLIDVVIQGQSFLHNQVRRMVGAAMAVARGLVSLDDVQLLLSQPDTGWNQKIAPARSEGLFLAKVEYKKESLELATEDYNKMVDLSKVTYKPSFGGLDEALSDSVTDDIDEAKAVSPGG